MKRTPMLLAAVAMMLFLLAGCSKQASDVPETEPVSSETVQATDAVPAASAGSRSRVTEVSNMQEFLNALAPDTEIILNPGTYVLTDAPDYGTNTGNSYYSWVDSFDGFELQLNRLDGLTIRGSSKSDTNLQAISRYANVLVFNQCSNVLLEDLTLGHTRGIPGECSGGVLNLNGCDEVTVNRCGLFGCGTIGINAFYSDFLTVTDSDIYDCSSSGLNLVNCRDVLIDNSRIYDLGKDYGAYTAIDISCCKRAVIRNCEIHDNWVYCILNLADSTKIEFLNNRIVNNDLKDYCFSVVYSNMTVDGNTVEGSVHRWYSPYSSNITDASGKDLTTDDLNALYPDCVTIAAPVDTESLQEIHVSTVDEFLAAIGSETVIVLDSPLYDLSTASDYGGSVSENYTWTDNFDGPALVIENVHNLTIRSNDGNPKKHTISAVPRYADVLLFRNCSNITLQGFTAGHTKEPGYCMGGVIHFEQCDSVSVESCSLFGCGTLGVQADFCNTVNIADSEIYECSYGGIQMYSTFNINVANCSFRDLGGDRLSFAECSNIIVDGDITQNGYYN